MAKKKLNYGFFKTQELALEHIEKRKVQDKQGDRQVPIEFSYHVKKMPKPKIKQKQWLAYRLIKKD
jgi:hypothetical protein